MSISFLFISFYFVFFFYGTGFYSTTASSLAPPSSGYFLVMQLMDADLRAQLKSDLELDVLLLAEVLFSFLFIYYLFILSILFYFIYFILFSFIGSPFSPISIFLFIHLFTETSYLSSQHTIVGLEFIHRHGLMHRDIKPENILCTTVNSKLAYKLTGFGIDKLDDDSSSFKSSSVGTEGFFFSFFFFFLSISLLYFYLFGMGFCLFFHFHFLFLNKPTTQVHGSRIINIKSTSKI